jgi:hypothetical protein
VNYREGLHLCIGNNFALMAAQLILATVAQVHLLRMASRHPPVIPHGMRTELTTSYRYRHSRTTCSSAFPILCMNFLLFRGKMG